MPRISTISGDSRQGQNEHWTNAPSATESVRVVWSRPADTLPVQVGLFFPAVFWRSNVEAGSSTLAEF